MDCSEFLHSYSDYRDGLITDARLIHRIRLHVERCGSCGRYDESVRRGVGALSEIDPSPECRKRLRDRIADPQYDLSDPLRGGTTGIAAALMLATALALAVYSRHQHRTSTPASAVTATAVETTGSQVADHPYPFVVANPGVPFVTFTALSSSPFHLVGAAEVQPQNEAQLSSWANLPH